MNGLGWSIVKSGRFFKGFLGAVQLASVMLYLLGRGALTMKFSRNLMTGLIGFALLAVPVAAGAKDIDRGGNDSHQAQAQSRSNESHGSEAHGGGQAMHNESRGEARVENHQARVENRNEARDNRQDFRNQAREQRNDRVETRNVAPEARQEFRGQGEGRTYNAAPAVTEGHDGDDGHGRWIYGDRGRDYDRQYDPDYDREYASGWVMPYSYSGGSCAWARHLRNVYNHDRYTGHPAAAESLLWQMHRAERACGGGRYGYNSYRHPY